jgi:hypothetical protein
VIPFLPKLFPGGPRLDLAPHGDPCGGTSFQFRKKISAGIHRRAWSGILVRGFEIVRRPLGFRADAAAFRFPTPHFRFRF